MRSLHIPMSWEEWKRLPWRFGWKHEYWDGHAHLTPRQDHVCVRLGLRDARARTTGEAPAGLRARRVKPADEQALVEAFIETFEDGVEFCDWPAGMVYDHARRNIGGYFAGRRGAPLLSASRLMAGEGGEVAGAALLTEQGTGPNLDLLVVLPIFRRRGVADMLVGAAVEELRARGVGDALRSAHSVSNVESAAWHRAFGFEEEPDLNLARLRRAFYAHEASRHEGPETAASRGEHARLQALYELWDRRTEELEKVARRDGPEAVMPVLRHDP